MDLHHFQNPSIFDLFLNVWSSSSRFTTDHIMRNILYIQLERIVIYEPHSISNTWKSLIGKERKEERVSPSYFHGVLSPDAYTKFHVRVVIRWQKKRERFESVKLYVGALFIETILRRGEREGKKRKKRERITRDFYSGSSRTITILNYESNVNEFDDELLYSVA